MCYRLYILDLRGDIYRPQRSCEGYVFTPVCHSVHRGGVCLSACWDTTTPPPSRSRHPTPGADTPPQAGTPQGADTPPEQAPPGGGTPQQTATVTDGTHPTGMHSCWRIYFPKIE